MAKLGINTGSSADDGTGDSLRVGAGKINSNFNEVYSLLTGAGNNGTTLLSGIVTSITAGSNITLSGGPTGAIEITAAALTGTGFFTSNSTGIHTLGSVGIGTTTAENNGLSVPLGNVFVGKGVTTLNLNVAGVTTFSGGDINISGDNYTAMWDASVDTLEFADNAKIAFGAGSDLTLYHDSNDSWVKDQATGNLYLDSNGAAVKITKAGAAETMAEFNTDGPVKLFHNNVRVLETVSTGATVVGDLYVGGDLFVLDDVTYNEMNSVNLNVSGVSTFSGDVLFDATNDVTFDNSESALVFNDGAAIRVGTGSDFSIMHDGSNTILKDNGTGAIHIRGDAIAIQNAGGTETQALFTEDDSVDLYFNGTERLSTTAIGATVFGDLVVAGVTTAEALKVTGISTFTGNVDANGGITANTVIIEDLTNNRVVIAGTGGEIEDDANFTYDGVGLNIGAGSGVTVSNTGNIAASGIVTANSGVQVGTSATISSTGNAAFAGIVTANGGVNVGTAVTIDA